MTAPGPFSSRLPEGICVAGGLAGSGRDRLDNGDLLLADE
jgi:hypothetical protein